MLTDLGIEGEYCKSGVDAVEKVTTQQFQIVITDWEDQPEAAFLLKTARDLKAAQRPLTLAIVSDDARLPEALQAGANSVLVKPIRTEQVRDTMSTACELLRAKQQPGTPQRPGPRIAAPMGKSQVAETAAMAAAASSGAFAAPASMTQMPEKTFRAGEFLQSPGAAPGTQFDTESEVQKSLDEAAGAEVDALTELEPTAAAVEDAPAEPAKPEDALTGWAALQARLTRAVPTVAEDAPAKRELLSYGETPSSGAPLAVAEGKDPAKKEPQPESGSEAALFAYMSGESKEDESPTEQMPPRRGRLLLAGALAVTCVVLVAAPRTRQSLQIFGRYAVRAGGRWLNPPPAPLPKAVVLHDSFGQDGDEYKLPVVGNIPDATTDPSKIQVLPVVDPTAKPKGSDASNGQAQAATGASNPADPNQGAPNQAVPPQTGPSVGGQSQSGPVQVVETPANSPSAVSAGNVPANGVGALPGAVPAAAPVQPNTPATQAAVPPPRPVAPKLPISTPHTVSSGNSAGIPTSLKSQTASTTPEASGAMPADAAMSSIEPVNLPESVVRGLLTEPVDPIYPDAAKAGGLRGNVVLQVLIGRDGAVQDAKFLQGSLVFAQSAIDAVRQCRFKPYSMNGRPVSVQSMITLNFKPPAQ
ncbi:MAG: TonB family protein [Candidatus Sulfotelmatobacter sp.]